MYMYVCINNTPYIYIHTYITYITNHNNLSRPVREWDEDGREFPRNSRQMGGRWVVPQ